MNTKSQIRNPKYQIGRSGSVSSDRPI
jgi:hypothetical protein